MTDTRPPGSPEARQEGCTCPVIDNHHGAGVAGNGARYGWWRVADCPLHGNRDHRNGEGA